MSILDEYEYENQIGTGYFSNVKVYKNKTTGQTVAVKHLKKDFADNADYIHRFNREIDLLKLLSGHPNIIELIGEGVKDGRPFYIMLAARTNLENYIAQNNATLKIKERIYIFDQVLEAIGHAHNISILHRDISPNNILIFGDEKIEIKVTDFGLGKNWAQDSGFTHSVTANYGQPIYTAPEQFDKLKNASTSSDIFSLGRLLDFVLTGKKPIVVHSGGAFKTLIEKATQPNQEDRFKNINEFKLVYERIKSIVIPDEDDDAAESVGFTNGDGGIDWVKFHRFAVKNDFIEHPYSEYVDVVTEILLQEDNVKNYVAVAPDSGSEFVHAYARRISELPSTGWPFRAISKFANVLKNICFTSKNDETKLLCLKNIWTFAYEQDQWGAQRIIQRIINENYIPEHLQQSFALEIIQSGASKINIADFENQNAPKIIKRAIMQKAREK